MYVCDWVLRAIEAEVGRHPPERGGALLGPPHRPLLSRFVPDPEAASTPSSYSPSRALDRRVKEVEARERLELKGIVHSHPSSMERPSEQDAYELGVGLRLNGHMPHYVAPIVTSSPPRSLQAHELPLGDGKIAFYAGHRAQGSKARVVPLPVHAVPLLSDLERLASELGAAALDVFDSDIGTGAVLAGKLSLPGAELLVLASELYPSMPPVLLLTPAGEPTEQLPIAWRLDAAADQRLVEGTRDALAPPGPYRRAFGPRGGPALTRDAARARLAGWAARFTGEDPDRATRAVGDGLFARSEGILSRDLRRRRALVVGCGSVGSYMAEQLARSGVGAFTLVDPERVEPANLSRAAYRASDLGRPKAEALAANLLHVDPALAVDPRPVSVGELEPRALEAMVLEADLVVAATDDPAAQRALNRFAYARGKPALFVGLYAGAHGGEVLATVPGRTPCYLCATRTRHGAERAGGRVSGEVDYGTARLRGEPALGADIQHVASAAVTLALSLLLPPESEASLRRFADEVLAGGASYLTMSMVPRYWFYPRIFGDTPGQGAYQAVWLTPSSDQECAVCGSPEHRIDPLEVPMRAPRLSSFARVPRAGDPHDAP